MGISSNACSRELFERPAHAVGAMAKMGVVDAVHSRLTASERDVHRPPPLESTRMAEQKRVPPDREIVERSSSTFGTTDTQT
jgi:hypothetical protein